MFQVHVTNAECIHPTSLRKADCPCFTKRNGRVPQRISTAQKILARLWFINNNAEAKNLSNNLRLREARLYLKQSKDDVILRYARLWHKKTENLAREADEEIMEIADRMQLEAVLPETTLTQQTKRLLVDEDDEEFEVSQSDDHARSPYNVEENSTRRQLSNFLSQTDAHFQERVENIFIKKEGIFK